MAKKSWDKKEEVSGEVKAPEKKEEMSLAEAKALRASRYKATQRVLSDADKKDAFRVYWAIEKSKYGKSKDLEEILWLHLQAVKMDDPSSFEKGINHFGLKKVE